MTRLRQLRVRGFRGIVDSTLSLDGGCLVLGGGNGTGKTGFVDALEFLYTGNIYTLSGVSGISVRSHAPHVQSNAENTVVEVDFVDPSGTASRSLRGSLDASPVLTSHLQRGAHLVFILRRSQLQEFIHARPAERYKHMADLIGAERLDKTEAVLKKARDTLDAQLKGWQSQLDGLERQLSGLPESPREAELLEGANAALRTMDAGEYRLEATTELGEMRRRVLREITDVRPDPRLQAQRELSSLLQRGLDQRDLREAIRRYLDSNRVSVDGSNREDLLNLLQVLERGRGYVQHTQADRCPLCNQEIETRNLIKGLARRIAELEAVSLDQQRLQSTRDELDMRLRDLTGQLLAIDRARTEAGEGSEATARLSNAIAMLRESLRRGAPVETAEMASRLEHSLDRWNEWATITATPSVAEEEPSDSDMAGRVNRILAVLESLQIRLTESRRAEDERARLEAERTRIVRPMERHMKALALADTVYTTFNGVKTTGLQRIYDELRADLVRFYEFLHPEEGHGAVTIAMDPRKRGSSELRMDFFQRSGEDPRAFGSEGHLDSLGLCIFLAFVKRFNGDWPLLVLDDVVASVDALHKRRIATLLFQEFGDRQLFITTHDSRWFTDLMRAEEETGRASHTRNVIIEGWTLEDGPRLRDMDRSSVAAS